jgi:hypothetical protein
MPFLKTEQDRQRADIIFKKLNEGYDWTWDIDTPKEGRNNNKHPHLSSEEIQDGLNEEVLGRREDDKINEKP